jgi:hypothetical protein
VTVNSPAGSTCSLTATENIIGRLVNGVPRDAVCTAAAYPPAVAGSFIHIEQDAEVRQQGSWEAWVHAFLVAFRGL